MKAITSKISMTAAALLLTMTTSNANAADKFCQCTDYVYNRLVSFGHNPTYNYPAARYWGSYLMNLGYTRVLPSMAIQNRDIAVIPPTYGSGIDSTYGHVAVVSSAATQGGVTYVYLVGANQGGTTRTEYGCTNVSNMTLSSQNSNFWTVEFYRKF